MSLSYGDIFHHYYSRGMITADQWYTVCEVRAMASRARGDAETFAQPGSALKRMGMPRTPFRREALPRKNVGDHKRKWRNFLNYIAAYQGAGFVDGDVFESALAEGFTLPLKSSGTEADPLAQQAQGDVARHYIGALVTLQAIEQALALAAD